MKSIVLIQAYFGKFNRLFPVQLHTMAENPEITFMLFTDQDVSDYKLPVNVVMHKTTFEKIRSLIGDKVVDIEDFVLNSPYKLVDYKPMFGKVFEDYIQSYDYWGFYDPDILFGKITHFVTEELLTTYDKMFTLGHFQIFKNTSEINELYKIEHNVEKTFLYRDVFKFETMLQFDEWGGKKGRGLSYALHRLDFPQYDELVFADIYADEYNFQIVDRQDQFHAYKRFYYDEGLLFGEDSNGVKTEFMYIHFQKRNMTIGITDFTSFEIEPTRLLSLGAQSDVMVKRSDKKKFNFEKNKRKIEHRTKMFFSVSYWKRRVHVLLQKG